LESKKTRVSIRLESWEGVTVYTGFEHSLNDFLII
jgi:hypothetical protein